MRLLTNVDNEIIGYSIIGGIDGDFEVSDDIIPSGFFDNYKPKYYIYKNNSIVVNPNYQSEETTFKPVVEEQPQPVQIDEKIKLMVFTLQKQSVQSNKKMIQLEKDNRELKERILELESTPKESEEVETYDN